MHFQNISLRDANHQFSRLVAAVERGEAFCITRRGKEVARLTPSPATASVESKQASQSRGNTAGITQAPAAITPPETALSERVRMLEARLDKLSSVFHAIEG